MASSNLIIGIGHKARQGKNELAKELVKTYCQAGYYAKQYNFSDALYNVARFFGMKEKNPRLLQALGTEVGRSLNENMWIDLLDYKLEEEKPDVAIIADVRFPNEWHYIHDHPWKSLTVRIDRYNEDGTRFISDDRDPNHISETSLDGWDWDHIVFNKKPLCADLIMGADFIYRTFN